MRKTKTVSIELSPNDAKEILKNHLKNHFEGEPKVEFIVTNCPQGSGLDEWDNFVLASVKIVGDTTLD